MFLAWYRAASGPSGAGYCAGLGRVHRQGDLMRIGRSLTSLFACAAVVLVSTAAFAAQYSFTGKFTSNRGKIINIPVVGNTPCAPLVLMTGPGKGGTMTPATHMIIRGANTQPQQMVTTNFTPYKAPAGRDLLCVRELR